MNSNNNVKSNNNNSSNNKTWSISQTMERQRLNFCCCCCCCKNLNKKSMKLVWKGRRYKQGKKSELSLTLEIKEAFHSHVCWSIKAEKRTWRKRSCFLFRFEGSDAGVDVTVAVVAVVVALGLVDAYGAPVDVAVVIGVADDVGDLIAVS